LAEREGRTRTRFCRVSGSSWLMPVHLSDVMSPHSRAALRYTCAEHAADAQDETQSNHVRTQTKRGNIS
jgi:hypothetical protein